MRVLLLRTTTVLSRRNLPILNKLIEVSSWLVGIWHRIKLEIYQQGYSQTYWIWIHCMILIVKHRSNGHNICLNTFSQHFDVETVWPPFDHLSQQIERCCDMMRRVWIHFNFVSTSSQHLFCSWNVERLLRPFGRASCGLNISQQMLRQMLWPFDRALNYMFDYPVKAYSLFLHPYISFTLHYN